VFTGWLFVTFTLVYVCYTFVAFPYVVVTTLLRCPILPVVYGCVVDLRYVTLLRCLPVGWFVRCCCGWLGLVVDVCCLRFGCLLIGCWVVTITLLLFTLFTTFALRLLHFVTLRLLLRLRWFGFPVTLLLRFTVVTVTVTVAFVCCYVSVLPRCGYDVCYAVAGLFTFDLPAVTVAVVALRYGYVRWFTVVGSLRVYVYVVLRCLPPFVVVVAVVIDLFVGYVVVDVGSLPFTVDVAVDWCCLRLRLYRYGCYVTLRCWLFRLRCTLFGCCYGLFVVTRCFVVLLFYVVVTRYGCYVCSLVCFVPRYVVVGCCWLLFVVDVVVTVYVTAFTFTFTVVVVLRCLRFVVCCTCRVVDLICVVLVLRYVVGCTVTCDVRLLRCYV